ncbi:MAG: hypothetical protein RDV41_00940 [Planctomycetota bacterium]|nr:hypothetical protein [Planctomycetota bacterium]
MRLLEKHGATIGLILFAVYAAILGTLAIDQAFGLGLFPTPLDKYLTERIEKLGDPDVVVAEEARRELVEQWRGLAVDTLIPALEWREPIRSRARACLVEITGQNFGMQPGPWEDWWAEHGDAY